MIRSFRHKGLAGLYERGNSRAIPDSLATKVSRVLARLDVARSPEQINLPGWRLHPLKGDLKGFWSVRVSANRRIVFRFQDGEAWDVDLVDYH